MPYIDDDSQIKCDLDALYSGDLLVEGDSTEETANQPITIRGLPSAPAELFCQRFPAGVAGWETA